MNGRMLALVAAAALAGCVDHKGSLHPGQINALDVQLLDPSPDNLGSPKNPVSVKHAKFNVLARDDQGTVLDVDTDVDVFISFGGIKTGMATDCGADVDGLTPIQTLHLTHGQAINQEVDLPSAFGPTAIWIDEHASGASGGSPTIYFGNPLISEVNTPADTSKPNFVYCSPFNNKFITFDHAKAGGQLVVTSVFGNAFAITDTGDTQYNSIYLYAFGKPPAYIVEGRVVNSFNGNISKFVGFTELNFPLFNVDRNSALVAVPAPHPLTVADVGKPANMLPWDAGVITYTGSLCNPLDPSAVDSWNKYNQFVLGNQAPNANPSQVCDSFHNVAVELPAKVLGSFNPLDHVNQTVTVVGMLQNHSGQNPYLDASGKQVPCPCNPGVCMNGYCYKNPYNFWTVLPRRQEDVTIQAAQ